MKAFVLFFGLALLGGCAQTGQPPQSSSSPMASPSPATASPNPAALANLQGSQVKDLAVVPFAGTSQILTTLVKDKAGAATGAYVALVDTTNAGTFILGHLPKSTPAQLDARPVLEHGLKVSGQLKPFRDSSVVVELEKQLGQSCLVQAGSPVYLELDQDPWPSAANHPTPKETP